MTRVLAILASASLFLALSGISHGADGPGAAPQKLAPKSQQQIVKYRCLVWRQKGIQSQAPAEALEPKLKSLGFQSYTTHQSGRYCVYYRLPAWRQKTFSSDAQARALESWLKSLGCEIQLSRR